MLKGLGNLASMMKQAQEMGSKMQAATARLKLERVIGSAGGGMVEVEVNGIGEVLRVKLEDSLVDKSDRELIEDLIPAAVNQALAKAKQLHADEMKEMAGGLNLPGLDEALGQITGNENPFP